MIKCAIVGGSGYIGGELMRLCLSHPQIELVAVTANEMAGSPIAKAHPGLSHLNKKFNALTDIGDADVVFFALPHGKAKDMMGDFPGKTIIDTSADFRQDKNSFRYGLPELFRDNIKASKHIASPGCFATAAILSIYPLVSEKLANGIFINAVTGSSGSGIKPQEKTHHAFREESYFAYEKFTHRHIPEIKQAILDKTGSDIDLVFQPHSGPFIRGIYMTSMVMLNKKMAKEEIQKIYEKYYGSEYFIRLLDNPPNIKWVKHTNFCDLNVDADGSVAVITVAIDNLLKGGASQAMQSFNILHGFEENTGLNMFAANP